MEENHLPRRKNPRLRGFDYSLPYVYFITICTFNRRKIFVNDQLNKTIIDCLIKEKDRSGVNLYVYCLMPDHLHLLIQPEKQGVNVSNFVGSFKSKAYRLCKKFRIEGKIWQPRFYDHIVRKSEDLSEIVKYILNNPVRKNLVEKWSDYPYSGCPDKII